MMRSMFSGVSGLKVHQTRMDVIGNNIANVNTVGYKTQRVTFNDVFSQTLQSASAASDETGRGGLNPMQVGLGVNVSSIDMLMTQGAAQRTDNPFDMMINGEGFIIVGDSNGKYFTRAGALRQDEAGNLIIANGMKVQGWASQYNDDTKKYEIVKGEVQSINLADPTVKSSSPSATTEVRLSGNLNASLDKEVTQINFYDSLGNYYTANINLTKEEGTNKWTATLDSNIKDAAGNPLTGYTAALEPTDFSFTFGTDGKLDETSLKGAFSLKFTPAATGGSAATAQLNDIKIDLSTLTQYASKSTIDSKTLDGNTAGTMTGYDIGSDGIITAYYDNGATRPLAQVVVAQFDNPAGLSKVGDNLYSATNNSGEFDGIGTTGNFNTGVLEMSNVDLASEFTDMIVTQRGFQANSRIISVSDEMLQELANLK